MRKTKYVSGYGYITGSGFWQDAAIELSKSLGKRVASAAGDVIGRKIANKMVKKDIIKQLDALPKSGLPEDVRRALYEVKNSKHLI